MTLEIEQMLLKYLKNSQRRYFLTRLMYYYYCFVDHIRSVRWSPSGDMLASATTTVALLDFKTGKKLFTEKTSDGSNFSLLFKNNYSHLIIRIC